MMFEIAGREKELTSVGAFIREARGGPSALVLEGEAGIGKSTLWLAGVEQARAQGLRVLDSRPAEAEQGLAHVGLGDLFEDVLDEVLPALAAPRRRALEIALLMEETSSDRVDPRALVVGVHSVLQLLAESDPLVIAVDDIQWLDSFSSNALAFALRRLASSDVLLLLARRLAEGGSTPGLVSALDVERVRRLSVGPLSVGALHKFLRDRLGRAFARQTLLRIHERSGGNPFFALELARVLDGESDLLEPLSVPETLEEFVRARIAALPEATREALALASAVGSISESLLWRAGVLPAVLEPAFATHVIERDGGTIRFTHPLLASVLYQSLGEGRRSVHARIADIAEDMVVRARHLALSMATPDAGVASLLVDSASLAADRGALAVAAELAEQAFRLTPADAVDARHRRALTAARAHHAAGEWTRARSIATGLLAETEVGTLRAEALVFLTEFELDDLSVPLLEEALHEAAALPNLQALIYIRLAWGRRFRKGFAAALVDARAALELAERLDDDALRFEALTIIVILGGAVGDREGPAAAARAQELAVAMGNPDMLKHANTLVAGVLVARGELDAARVLLELEYREWFERDEVFCAEVLWELSWLELFGGRWELAADYADRARDLSTQYGVQKNQDFIPVVWVAAYRGQLDFAREQSERALELCRQQLGLLPPLLLAVPGLVALWSGDAALAADRLGQADRQAASLGWGEASRRPWSADYVEALLELGQIDDAVCVVDVWEADAKRLGRAAVLAHVTRCRGLVAAAVGDIARACSLLEQAVTEHEKAGDPFGQARALLALGVVRRRARQKRAGRDAIGEALARFERLGAATFIEKARGELGSIGGRARQEGLTAAELRVAALVVEGRTNREVAAALVLGERTVAGHLTHIYAKLGVRSRMELARRLQVR